MSTDEDVLTVFARNLKAARDEKGWSQEKLSEEAGLHRTYVGLIENEKGSPSLETIQRLAEALDREVWELFKESE